MRRFFGVLVALTGALVLAGCGEALLPTFDEVRDETHVEMQKIVNRLPDGVVVRVDEPMPDYSYRCKGDGVAYTGEWEVYVADGFEIQPWVEDVKGDLLADGYVEDGIELQFVESFSVRTPETHLLIGVDNDEEADEGPRILVSGYSRCAQDPNAEE